jgi:hypothetical protein
MSRRLSVALSGDDPTAISGGDVLLATYRFPFATTVRRNESMVLYLPPSAHNKGFPVT